MDSTVPNVNYVSFLAIFYLNSLIIKINFICFKAVYSQPEIRDLNLKPFIEDDYPLIEFPNLETTTTTTRAKTSRLQTKPVKMTSTKVAANRTTPKTLKKFTAIAIRNQSLKKRYPLNKIELNGEKKRYEDDYIVIVDDEGEDSSLNLANVYAIMINENNETDYLIDSLNIGGGAIGAQEKSMLLNGDDENIDSSVGFSDYDEDADYDDDDDDDDEDYDEDDEDDEEYDDYYEEDEEDDDVETYEEEDIERNKELLKFTDICKCRSFKRLKFRLVYFKLS